MLRPNVGLPGRNRRCPAQSCRNVVIVFHIESGRHILHPPLSHSDRSAIVYRDLPLDFNYCALSGCMFLACASPSRILERGTVVLWQQQLYGMTIMDAVGTCTGTPHHITALQQGPNCGISAASIRTFSDCQ